jgi:antitoxin (DNA-binding transcriptional repressor) of toxin-antitoxin stability system
MGAATNAGDRPMPTKSIDVRKEPPPDLQGLLSIVAQGTDVVLTEGDTPIARLVPAGKRVAGLHAGAIRTEEDFDEPLPDGFWTGSE